MSTDDRIETDGGIFSLSSHRYAPDVVYPDGVARIESFSTDPWPSWRFRLNEHTIVEQSIFVAKGLPITVVRWTRVAGSGPVRLRVRPFLAGRDYHALHHENGAFRFPADAAGNGIRWCPYDRVQPILAASNGVYQHSPDWYRNFLYAQERARGLDAVEDLAAPGLFEWDLSTDATLILAAETEQTSALLAGSPPSHLAIQLADSERTRRGTFHDRLERAADAYLVRRGSGATIVAGYPWFTDWGRDTFIAIRGLCLATGRYREAGQILLQWADAVSEGMLPNRFPDAGDAPEFNAVDASLWYIVAAHEWLQIDPEVSASERNRIHSRSTRSSTAMRVARGSESGQTTMGFLRPASRVFS